MKRGCWTMPLLMLAVIVISLGWRLLRPEDPAVRSQLVSMAVPQFALVPIAAGKPGLSSGDLRDGRPKLLNLFASWCVPCGAEAPVLAELRNRGVQIDAIAIRDTPEAVAAFLAKRGDPYRRMGSDPTSATQIALGSSGVPETFVVDGRGVIRHQYLGPLTKANIPGVLAELEQVR